MGFAGSHILRGMGKYVTIEERGGGCWVWVPGLRVPRHLEFTSLQYLNLWFCDFKNVDCFLSFWDGNMVEEIVLGTSQVKA